MSNSTAAQEALASAPAGFTQVVGAGLKLAPAALPALAVGLDSYKRVDLASLEGRMPPRIRDRPCRHAVRVDDARRVGAIHEAA